MDPAKTLFSFILIAGLFLSKPVLGETDLMSGLMMEAARITNEVAASG